MSNIGKLMKQAARMQQQMEEVQAQLAARTIEATSGGGAVKVVAKCDGSIALIFAITLLTIRSLRGPKEACIRSWRR